MKPYSSPTAMSARELTMASKSGQVMVTSQSWVEASAQASS